MMEEEHHCMLDGLGRRLQPLRVSQQNVPTMPNLRERVQPSGNGFVRTNLRERMEGSRPQYTSSYTNHSLSIGLCLEVSQVQHGSPYFQLNLAPTKFCSRPLAHTHITSHHNAINCQLEECRNLRPGPAKS